MSKIKIYNNGTCKLYDSYVEAYENCTGSKADEDPDDFIFWFSSHCSPDIESRHQFWDINVYSLKLLCQDSFNPDDEEYETTAKLIQKYSDRCTFEEGVSEFRDRGKWKYKKEEPYDFVISNYFSEKYDGRK